MKPLVIALIVLLQCAIAAPVDAQVLGDVRIVVKVSLGRADSGDRFRAATVVEPGGTGKTTAMSFSRLAGQCGIFASPEPLGEFGETSDGTMKKVVSTWTVQVTPYARVDEAVKFRLQWMRSRDNGKPSSVGDDVELALSPGQSLSLDVMPQTASVPAGLCVMYLSVGVVHWPEPDRDRRLVAVDLWLVDRLPDGTDRSQPLSLRGLYNQPIPFYFDTLTEGFMTLDVFGAVVVSPGERTTEVTITTRSRVIDMKPPQRPAGHPAWAPWPLPPYVGLKTATLHLVPDEVVSVLLPPVGNGRTDAAAFAPRALSFRIRVRRVR